MLMLTGMSRMKGNAPRVHVLRIFLRFKNTPLCENAHCIYDTWLSRLCYETMIPTM